MQELTAKFKKIPRLYFFIFSILVLTLPIFFTLYKQKNNIKSKAENEETVSIAVQPAKLSEYWDGQAAWKYRNKMTLTSPGFEKYGYGGGSHIIIVNGIWYHFGQKIYFDKHCSGNNKDFLKQGIEVRESTDEGITWSNSVEIVSPTDGTEWECGAADGDVYYNKDTQTYNHLFQCITNNGNWNTCYLQRSAQSPIGIWTETNKNPVISMGELWSKICNSPEKNCVKIAQDYGKREVFIEGTPNIFNFDGSYYFVSFHGYDGNNGYSGIAKTSDFSQNSWIVGDEKQGVPSDDNFDREKVINWRENWKQGSSVGGGAARILNEEGYYYRIIEAADMNLGCTDGQNWDQGIYRTNDLTNTNWDPYPEGNPILYSSKQGEKSRGGKSPSCNPAYAGIFRDDKTGKVYMNFTRVSEDPDNNGVFIYELVKNDNLLKNADLWKCNIDEWQVMPDEESTANLNVYRYPDKSSDSNCYMSVQKDDSIENSRSVVYQDVNLDNKKITSVVYGGKFAAEAESGEMELILDEFDGNNNLLDSHKQIISLYSDYQSIENEVDLNPDTALLRYQILPLTKVTIKADEMYVNQTTSAANTLEENNVTITPSLTPTDTPEPTPTDVTLPTDTPTEIPFSTSNNIPE